MKIEHIAIWAEDIEVMREFYLTYFDTECNEKYVNKDKRYSSYFISFKEDGARIELMHRPDIYESESNKSMTKGIAHIAVTVGSKEDVNKLTERMRNDNHSIISEPRTTGDGFYESVISDPEGNWIELLGDSSL